MGNLLRYTNKSQAINKKLSTLLAQINYDYQNGLIRTETEYYYRIKKMLTDFYASLTKPTFKFRPAVSTPMSDEYNAMITESYNDMQYIIRDCEALQELVSQSFSDAELGRKMLANEVAYLTKKVDTISQSITTNQRAGSVVFTELFSDLDHTGNAMAENSLQVDTDNDILTLRRQTVNHGEITYVAVDEEFSNGFPGNSHCIDTMNSELHFIGEDGIHNDINAILDNNSDTWYEFESFAITDETRKACNSYGFEYDEGVSWVNNDEVLRLKLIAKPSKPIKCSWVALTPYLSDVKGVKDCILEKCEVVTASNNVYQVGVNVPFSDVLVFPFPPQEVERIEFTLVQPSKYKTKVGHFYYTAADTTSMSIFQEFDYSDQYARIDGAKPSVALLGCKYDPTTQWVKYASTADKIVSKQYAKDGLFKCPPSTIDKKSNQEIIDAYRYMIGIRNITISCCTFAEEGEYISKAFHTEDTITSVCIDSVEYIPGTDPEILQYAISLNGGVTWHKIYPTHRAYQGIYKYYINNDSIDNMLAYDTKNRRSKNLNIVGDPKSIQVKIYMRRPDSLETNNETELASLSIQNTREYATPIVYQYRLRLTTGGETIEY